MTCSATRDPRRIGRPGHFSCRDEIRPRLLAVSRIIESTIRLIREAASGENRSIPRSIGACYSSHMPDPNPASKTRIVILGGGFAGVYTALHLQRIWRRDPAVQVTLISRDNFFLMTPLLFEAGSGILEPRHAVNPIRPMFDCVQFIQAEVNSIDLDTHRVHVHLEGKDASEIEYDHLVLALGGITNTALVPGSEHALTFKTMGDAIFLRNHSIQRFEARRCTDR